MTDPSWVKWSNYLDRLGRPLVTVGGSHWPRELALDIAQDIFELLDIPLNPLKYYVVTMTKGPRHAIVAILGDSPEDAMDRAKKLFGEHMAYSVGTEPASTRPWTQVGGDLIAVEDSGEK